MLVRCTKYYTYLFINTGISFIKKIIIYLDWIASKDFKD